MSFSKALALAAKLPAEYCDKTIAVIDYIRTKAIEPVEAFLETRYGSNTLVMEWEIENKIYVTLQFHPGYVMCKEETYTGIVNKKETWKNSFMRAFSYSEIIALKFDIFFDISGIPVSMSKSNPKPKRR